MSELRFTWVQNTLHWEDKEANLNHFEQLLNAINEPTDVVVLPEMFSTGFSMNTGLAEPMDGKSVQWMQQQAFKLGIPLCGSLMITEDGCFFNRFIWMNPDGTHTVYNKRHLFRMGDEHRYFTAGTQQVIISYKGWKLQLLVCYDLRFPVWIRRTPQHDYDAILITANWPERRIAHWRTLLQARAIENQCYVVAVNRIGEDGNGVNHIGNSGLLDPKGEWINDLTDTPEIRTVVLHKQEVTNWRAMFPAANDADSFALA